MLKKRIIPCLDIQNGRTVKGINFVGIRDAGDPVALAQRYVAEGADELVFLDITATIEKRKTLVPLVEDIARHINIPFTVGGGIKNLAEAKAVIEAGADKVSVNSSAVRRLELVRELAEEIGSQAVVAAIDSKATKTGHRVFVNGGRTATEKDTVAWAQELESYGAGEILLTSMNQDGAKSGFDLGLCEAVARHVQIPVIASGGAGTKTHFVDVFTQTNCTAALAASIFHFGEIPIPALKKYLHQNNVAIR